MTNLREPSQPAAIMGTFANYKLVPTRSVLQVIVEVPVEQQAAVFAALGYPIPGSEINVAIARLNTQASRGGIPAERSPEVHVPDGEPSGLGGNTSGERRDKSPAERAVTRAALLPRDPQFRGWVAAQWQGDFPDYGAPEEAAAAYIRETCCGGNSRRLIGEDPECMDRFISMETRFLIDVGRMAEPR